MKRLASDGIIDKEPSALSVLEWYEGRVRDTIRKRNRPFFAQWIKSCLVGYIVIDTDL
ncbi:MAG: hypothetical protein M0Z71_12870 [Nitrospiraceae bacterium]|nr:hypothetical protein [Nitrospiraceae bacterium]